MLKQKCRVLLINDPSEFEAYLSPIDANRTFSDADFAYSQLIKSKINDVLCTIEKLERITFLSVWDIISHYPRLVQLLCKIISCLPSTQVSVEQMFSHIKVVLQQQQQQQQQHFILSQKYKSKRHKNIHIVNSHKRIY